MNAVQQTTSPHAERQYLHTLVAGALLPLAQSTIAAVVVAVGAWTIAYFVFDMLDSYKAGILFFAVTWIYMIWKLQRHWLSLTTIEQIIQYDINNDGVIGEPQPVEQKPRRVVIQLDTVKEDGHYQVGDLSARITLPCADDQLHTLAMGLIDGGMSFSEKQWCGKGKPFSTDEFRELRAEMKKHGLTEYVNEKDHRQGIRLTDAGKAVMQEYAASPTPL